MARETSTLEAILERMPMDDADREFKRMRLRGGSLEVACEVVTWEFEQAMAEFQRTASEALRRGDGGAGGGEEA